jgi:hypothetical protein
LTCSGLDPLAFRVEDRSTNGTFVNEVRVVKGQSAELFCGDILSLGKAVEDHGGVSAGARTQFRLEAWHQEQSAEMLGQPSLASRDLQGEPTSMEANGQPSAGQSVVSVVHEVGSTTSGEELPPVVRVISSAMSTAEGFAQDLLVQEQRSKAKITSELLLVRRRLDEERSAREALDRDLRKARVSLEDERTRRTSAQEVIERLQNDAGQFRQEHSEFQKLRQEHCALESTHEAAEVELGSLLQRATTLEAGQEHLRVDCQRAVADEARVKSQIAEAQARLQQAQERFEVLQKRNLDTRRAAEVAQESVERFQRELSNERSTREQLADQAALLRADAERAWHGEGAAKDALATAVAQQAELESQIIKCRDEASSLRTQTKESRHALENDTKEAEQVRGASDRFVQALRIYADCWLRGLGEGCQPVASNVAAQHMGQTKTIHSSSSPCDKSRSPEVAAGSGASKDIVATAKKELTLAMAKTELALEVPVDNKPRDIGIASKTELALATAKTELAIDLPADNNPRDMVVATKTEFALATAKTALAIDIASDNKLAHVCDKATAGDIHPSGQSSQAEGVGQGPPALSSSPQRPPIANSTRTEVDDVVQPQAQREQSSPTKALQENIAPAILMGKQHGMASLMVGSQDSPPAKMSRPQGEDQLGTQVGTHVHGNRAVPPPRVDVVRVNADVPDASSVQRMASASIFTLMAPPKRPQQSQQQSSQRKRARAR